MKRISACEVIVLVAAMVAAVGLPGTISSVAAADKPAAAKAQTPAPAAQPASPGVNGITQAAVKAGVLACTSRINQVSNFLTAGIPSAGVYLYMPPAEPDRNLISMSLEIFMPDATTAYASASFAPNQANGCGGLYESVVYWPQGCNDVAARNFPGLKKAGVLAKNIIVLDGGALTKIFLMPADKGCVAIKKELVQ